MSNAVEAMENHGRTRQSQTRQYIAESDNMWYVPLVGSLTSHRLVSPRPFLFLIGVAYGLLVLSYAILIPPWEAPDEPAHYLYVSQLASNWRPPPKPSVSQTDWFFRDQPFMSSNYEWYQPPLGYLPAALVYKGIDVLAPSFLPRSIPRLNASYSSSSAGSYNVFVHPNPSPIRVWRGSEGLLIIRLVSSIWGLVVLVGTYLVGRHLEKEDHLLAIAMTAWVAFLPQFTFINASVRSDNPANAVAALVFLISAMILSRGQVSNKLVLVLGCLLAIGLLSKYAFIYVPLVAMFAVVLVEFRSPANLVKHLTLLFAPTIIGVGAYHLAYEEARLALAYSLTTAISIKPGNLTWGYMVTIPEPLFADLFYARFGWANVGPPAIWSRLALYIWLVGVAITVLQAWRLRNNSEWYHPLRITAVLVVGILLAIAGVIRYNLAVYQPQGRLLFPAIVAWAGIGLWGTSQVLSAQGKRILAMTVATSMLIFNFFSLVFFLIPAYY